MCIFLLLSIVTEKRRHCLTFFTFIIYIYFYYIFNYAFLCICDSRTWQIHSTLALTQRQSVGTNVHTTDLHTPAQCACKWLDDKITPIALMQRFVVHKKHNFIWYIYICIYLCIFVPSSENKNGAPVGS